jgi:hypothetical protein
LVQKSKGRKLKGKKRKTLKRKAGAGKIVEKIE